MTAIPSDRYSKPEDLGTLLEKVPVIALSPAIKPLLIDADKIHSQPELMAAAPRADLRNAWVCLIVELVLSYWRTVALKDHELVGYSAALELLLEVGRELNERVTGNWMED